MNTLEQTPDFGMETGFDINIAFQEAVYGVMSDTELAVEEKIQRMEVIVSEGNSEVYRDFVDFRAMAAQMEMMCNHDHALNQSIQANGTLSDFIDSFKPENSHNHGDLMRDKQGHKEEEIDPKTGKKKRKTYKWLFG